jgi:hypothetical protein
MRQRSSSPDRGVCRDERGAVARRGKRTTSQRISLSRCEDRRRSAAADRADSSVGFGRDVGRGHGGRGHPTRRGRCRRLRGGGRGIGARCALHGTRPSAHHDDRSRRVRGPAARRGGDGLGADARHLAHPGREAPGAGRQPEGRSRDQPRLLPMRKRSRCLGVSDAAATVRTSSTRPIVLPNTCTPRSQSRGGGRPGRSSRDTRNCVRQASGVSPSPDCCSRPGTRKPGATRRRRLFWNDLEHVDVADERPAESAQIVPTGKSHSRGGGVPIPGCEQKSRAADETAGPCPLRVSA